jgi:hypothetical protein
MKNGWLVEQQNKHLVSCNMESHAKQERREYLWQLPNPLTPHAHSLEDHKREVCNELGKAINTGWLHSNFPYYPGTKPPLKTQLANGGGGWQNLCGSQNMGTYSS